MIQKKEKSYDILKQIMIIATVIFAFMTSACIGKFGQMNQHKAAFIVTAAIDLVLLGAWSWVGTRFGDRLLSSRKYAKKVWRDNKGILIVLSYCFATRIVQLGDTPRWDALTYYRVFRDACNSFDFTFPSFLTNFSLAFHPTLGYAGLAAIGEFLAPESYVGVLWMQLVLHLIMGVCLYRIFQKVLPRCSWIYHTLGTCIALSTPLMLGTFSYFHPDAGTVYFFIFVVYSYLYKKTFLMFFSMLLLVETKEIGSIIIAGFALGVLLGKILITDKEKSAGKRFLSFFKEPLGISCMAAALFLAVYFALFLKSGGIIWNIGDGNKEGFSTFTFQPAFVVYKWKQFFVLNFNWIVWGENLLLTAVFGIKVLLGRRDKRRIYHKDAVLGIFFAAFSQMVFYSFYITYTLPRYHVLIDFCGVILLVIFIGAVMAELSEEVERHIVLKYRLLYIAAFGTGTLFLGQAYTTIDPVSLAVFRNETTGNSRIVRADYLGSIIQRDFCVYNHQYTYLNKAYDMVLRDAGYYEGMDVLIWNSVVNDEIFSCGYSWDMEEQKRTLKSGDGIITINGVEREMIDKGEVLLQSEAVFILTPQFIVSEEYAENYLKKYYEIRYKGYVDVPFGGKVTFYVCDLIKQVGEE